MARWTFSPGTYTPEAGCCAKIGAELGAHWSTLIDQFHRAGLVAPVAMIKKALKLKDSGYGGHPGRVQDEHLGIRNGSPSTSD